MLTVTFNGQVTGLDKSVCLDEFLKSRIRPDEGYFAVSVNKSVVHKGKYISVWLRDGDEIELLRATVGG